MKKHIFKYIGIAFLLFAFASIFSESVRPQQISAINGKCQSPYQLQRGGIRVQNTGDIFHVPCPTRSSVFYGNVDFTNAVITGAVTGSGTTNFVPRWTGSSALGNTPFSWNGTVYRWSDAALSTTFPMAYEPTSGTGVFSVGDAATPATGGFSVTQGGVLNLTSAGIMTLRTAPAQFININSDSGVTNIGDTDGAANGTRFTVEDANQFFTFNVGAIVMNNSCAGTGQLDGAGSLDLTANACYVNASNAGGFPLIFATGVNSTGVLTNAAGTIVSSAGLTDAGDTVQFLIIGRP